MSACGPYRIFQYLLPKLSLLRTEKRQRRDKQVCHDREEILRTAEEAVGAGYETIVLQSGEGSLSPEALGDIVASIKSMKTKKGVHPAVTLSCGQMKKEDYALLRKRGADRYLLKHETADRDFTEGSIHREEA